MFEQQKLQTVDRLEFGIFQTRQQSQQQQLLQFGISARLQSNFPQVKTQINKNNFKINRRR